MDLRGIGWDGMDWIELAQDRDQRRALVNTMMNLRLPIVQPFRKFRAILRNSIIVYSFV
jgi:hypothetical protein